MKKDNIITESIKKSIKDRDKVIENLHIQKDSIEAEYIQKNIENIQNIRKIDYLEQYIQKIENSNNDKVNEYGDLFNKHNELLSKNSELVNKNTELSNINFDKNKEFEDLETEKIENDEVLLEIIKLVNVEDYVNIRHDLLKLLKEYDKITSIVECGKLTKYEIIIDFDKNTLTNINLKEFKSL